MPHLYTSLQRATCLLLVLFFTGLITTNYATAKPKRLLVVTVTKGFRHDSIPTAERVITEIAQQHKFTLDFARTDDELRARTTREKLAAYDGIIFANTTGDLPLADRAAFIEYIRAGHAFIGIHSATDTFRNGVFPEYTEMIGGEFDSHGEQVSVTMNIEDAKHPATKHLDSTLTVFDEIYLIRNFNRRALHTLLSLDCHPNTKVPGYFPLAWTRMYGTGRVFYTALGHREDVLQAAWFRRHLTNGIRWTLGEVKGSAKPQAVATGIGTTRRGLK